MSLPPVETNIPSYAVSNCYCIFICKKAAPFFATWVKQQRTLNAWLGRDFSLKVIESTDEVDDLAAIVIPSDKNIKGLEKDLFEFKNNHIVAAVKESGFWGQPNIGYKNKTWNLID
jgi:hypothetical protein